MMNQKKTLLYSFRSSLPVMAGYVVLGIGFGILLESKGYGILWAFAMSLFIYAGSMQYVAIDLLAVGANLITVAIMTLMVNIRHIFYGITMLLKYKDTGKEKPYLIFALTDETFSLVCSPDLPEGVDRKKYYFFVSLFNQIYWITGSLIGNILGNVIPFSTKGIDFSMTALFLVILFGQWESTKEHKPALTGILISVICLLIFGADSFLIPSMIGITIALFGLKRFMKEEEL
ncbi:MAG: AzlC family ABC transporter permease [Eubacteriales bacterium]|nr:AzlC family ABC transporter permease [Eubacteriales bacterium]